MRYSTQVKPISYLKAHAAEILSSLGERREPLVITQNGEAKAVALVAYGAPRPDRVAWSARPSCSRGSLDGLRPPRTTCRPRLAYGSGSRPRATRSSSPGYQSSFGIST